MNQNTRSDYLMLDGILNLLSDDEVAKVATAETTTHLTNGEQYLDLERLERGVQCAPGNAPAMGRLLIKSAVHPTTWEQILARLAAPVTNVNLAT